MLANNGVFQHNNLMSDFGLSEIPEPGDFETKLTPEEQERAARIAAWEAQALGDEEQIARTGRLLRTVLSEPSVIREQVLSGELTIEEAGTMASLVVSDEVTGRNIGGAKAVGEAITRLMPPGILE